MQKLKFKARNKLVLVTFLFVLYLQGNSQIDSCRFWKGDTVLVFKQNKTYKLNVNHWDWNKSLTYDSTVIYCLFTEVNDALQPHYYLQKYKLKGAKFIREFQYDYFSKLPSGIDVSIKNMDFIVVNTSKGYQNVQKVNLSKIQSSEEFKKYLKLCIDQIKSLNVFLKEN